MGTKRTRSITGYLNNSMSKIDFRKPIEYKHSPLAKTSSKR